MVTRTYETVMPVSPKELAAFHADVRALKLLAPPGQRVEVLSDDIEVRDGALHELRVRQGPISFVWRARISEVGPNGFTDTSEQSPFKFWRHRHEFLPHPEGSKLRDTVTYEPPLAWLTGWVVNRMVDKMFARRHRVTLDALLGAFEQD